MDCIIIAIHYSGLFPRHLFQLQLNSVSVNLTLNTTLLLLFFLFDTVAVKWCFVSFMKGRCKYKYLAGWKSFQIRGNLRKTGIIDILSILKNGRILKFENSLSRVELIRLHGQSTHLLVGSECCTRGPSVARGKVKQLFSNVFQKISLTSFSYSVNLFAYSYRKIISCY